MKKIIPALLIILMMCCFSCQTSKGSVEEAADVEVTEDELVISEAEIVKTAKTTAVSKNEEAIALYRKGCEAITAGDFVSAETYFRQALELDPEYVDALDNLGITLRRLGKTDEAIEVLKKSISINPYNRVPYISLCIAYIDKKDYANGLKICQDHIAKIPDDGEAYYNEGVIYMRMTEYKSAVSAFKTAIMLFQKNDEERLGDAVYNIGFCFYALKDWDNAIGYMEMAQEYYPDDPDLIDFLLSAKDWKEISY